jgi:hypothetical protein
MIDAFRKEFADLVVRYKASKHFDKLKISDEIWQRSIAKQPDLRQQGHNKKEWLSKILDVQAYDIEMRESLRFAPEVLIEHVDNGLVMRSAMIMLKEARQIATEKKEPIQISMETVIEIHKTGTRRHAPDRTWFWMKPTLAKAATKVASGQKAAKVEESDTVRSHWATIRSAIAQISIKKADREIEPLVLEEANVWFMKELERVIDGFSTRLRKNKRKEVVEVNRMQYANACKTLGIVPSSVGEEIDIDVAKAAKKSLARKFHPDAGGESTDKSTEKYQQVIEAFETIDLYADQMRRIARNQSKSRGKETDK